MRLYLDTCCLNRPFDDQSQVRVRLETEAILEIFAHVEVGDWTLLSSSVLLFESARIPDPQRRAHVERPLSLARETVVAGADEIARARGIQLASGADAFDSLHLACAETLRADAFLSTDDHLLRKCRRMNAGRFTFKIDNPLA